jgi:hypothetical protein
LVGVNELPKERRETVAPRYGQQEGGTLSFTETLQADERG